MSFNLAARLSVAAASLTTSIALFAGAAAAQHAIPNPAPDPGPAETTTATTTTTVTTPDGADATTPTHAVFLHAEPNGGSPVIATLKPGMALHVLASGSYGWMQVASPVGTGWAYGSYLSPNISSP